MIEGKVDTVCTECNRRQNLTEMLRIKKSKATYKIVCAYCRSDKIRPLTDKIN